MDAQSMNQKLLDEMVEAKLEEWRQSLDWDFLALEHSIGKNDQEIDHYRELNSVAFRKCLRNLSEAYCEGSGDLESAA